MPSRECYRLCLEAAIRRLHVTGYKNFYIQDQQIILKDTNVLAWIVDECHSIGLPDADLVVQDDDEHVVRAYIFILAGVQAADIRARERIQNLTRQLQHLGQQAAQVLRVLTIAQDASLPYPMTPQPCTTAIHDVPVESISVAPTALVLDFLRMSKANIFNSSNTPTAPPLIAEALGISEAEVITACEQLASNRSLEVIRLSDRPFYRIP